MRLPEGETIRWYLACAAVAGVMLIGFAAGCDSAEGPALRTMRRMHLMKLSGSATVQPGGNVQSAMNGAATVNFAAGTFNLGATTLNSGNALLFAPNFGSHLVFGVGSNSGFVSTGTLTNVTIGAVGQGADITSTGDVLKHVYGSTALHIIGNRIQYGTGGQGDIFGLYLATPNGVPQNGLQVEWNYLHDSPNTDRNWELWYIENANLDHNTFFNIHDGGHIEHPYGNVSFSDNYGTSLIRMGQEIEGYSDSTQPGLFVENNVFYDWQSLDQSANSFAVSVVANYTPDTVISGNFFRASFAAGANAVGNWGYMIESGAPGAVVQNNTGVGNWKNTVVSSSNPATPTQIIGNMVYGAGAGTFADEPGNGWNGAYTASGNQFLPLASAPQPPANTNAGPTTQPTPPTPPPAPVPTVVITPGPSKFNDVVTWTALPATAVDLIFNLTTTGGNAPYGPYVIPAPGAAGSAVFGNGQLPDGWGYVGSFSVVGSAGTLATGSIPAFTSTGTFSDNPPPATQPVVPTTQVFHVTETGTITFNSAGVPSGTLTVGP